MRCQGRPRVPRGVALIYNKVPKKLRRLLLGPAAILVMLGLLLLAGYEVVVHIAQPDAVQISQSVDATGHILAQRTITDPRTVADYYARINRLPELPPDTYYVSCLPINVSKGDLFLPGHRHRERHLHRRWVLPVVYHSRPWSRDPRLGP